MSLVLRNVALPDAAELGGCRQAPAAGVELRVEAGRITAIAGRVARRAGDVVVDGDGGVVHPGLHDHHVHLHAAAAAGRSVDVGPAAVDGPAGLSAALRSAAADSAGGWVRAVGYHESVAGPLDRLALDAIVVDRPVRVQHRSGVLWSLNSAALARLGAASASAPGIERDERGVPTGRLWREDRWVGRQLAALGETGPASDHRRALAAVAAAAAGRGVTGFTDADVDRPDADLEAFAGLAGEGLIPQRLHLMLRPGTPEAAVAVLPTGGRVTPGPVKVLLDDDRLPPVDGLARLVAASHARRRPVAVHCVTAVQLVVALTAFDEAGTVPGDRLEHAAVVAGDLIGAIRRLGLTVVTQPGLVAARGDSYLRDVDPVDVADLWRAGSLARHGCTVAAGTDAPHGPDDPWLAMATAVSRRTTGGALLGPAEAVDAVTARRWWEGRADAPGHRRRVAVGEPGDLVVVEPGGSGPSAVVVTVVAGVVVHRRGPAPG